MNQGLRISGYVRIHSICRQRRTQSPLNGPSVAAPSTGLTAEYGHFPTGSYRHLDQPRSDVTAAAGYDDMTYNTGQRRYSDSDNRPDLSMIDVHVFAAILSDLGGHL